MTRFTAPSCRVGPITVASGVMATLLVTLLTVVSTALHGCRETAATEPTAIRLVDLLRPEAVDGRVALGASELARTEWRFDCDSSSETGEFAETCGWEAGHEVENVRIVNVTLAKQIQDAIDQGASLDWIQRHFHLRESELRD